MSKKKKQRFTVLDNETIEQCLERMKQEGYIPTRRIEEPIFHEIEINGEIIVEPCGRTITFDGILSEN